MARVAWRMIPHAFPAAGLVGAGFFRHASLSRCQDEPRLLRVSYISTLRGDASTAKRELESIIEHATRTNQGRGISGHLSYDAKVQQVWQVLEGSPETVGAVWDKISSDARHVVDEDTVTVEEITKRKYPATWGMRCSTFQDAEPRSTDPDDGLIQLTYKSFMTEHNGSEKAIVEGVMPRAQQRNQSRGVTGFLLYNDRNLTIYQVLEGPKQAVDEIWQYICKDPRHVVCHESVRRKAIQSRQFDDWSMCLEAVEQSSWAQQSW